ncbi:MAG: hypothetical protein AB7O56_04255 [Bauldia sp.]
MKESALLEIERALDAFNEEDQARLGKDFVAYLQRLKALRDELAIGEQALAEGRVFTLEQVRERMEEVRRRHAAR